MFVDIHCHILPHLDDGASTQEEAMEMLKIARSDGVAEIAATPHIMTGRFNNTREEIEASVNMLKQRVETNNPVLYTGAELRICPDLIALASNRTVPTINNTEYLLLEFPSFTIPSFHEMINIIAALKMKKVTPIIVHPERNTIFIQKIQLMKNLIPYGALFQVTSASITKDFGRIVHMAVLKMIEKGVVHVVATDAHNSTRRPPVLSEAYIKVARLFGEEEAKRLFIVNPSNIVRGLPVVEQSAARLRKKSTLERVMKFFLHR